MNCGWVEGYNNLWLSVPISLELILETYLISQFDSNILSILTDDVCSNSWATVIDFKENE